MVFFYILVLSAFFLGGSIASFLGVVVERGKNGKPPTGRSHCICGRQLRWSENIPVIGWLKSLGKAKCCGSKIPSWYFWSELVTGFVFATITWLLLSQFMV